MGTSNSERPRCLVIADFATFAVGTVIQHVKALKAMSGTAVALAHVGALARIPFNPNKYDVIVFHYSVVVARGFHMRDPLRRKLAALRALKILFIQDEYRWVDATAEAIRELGISVIFTVLNEEIVDRVYHHDWLEGVRKEMTLTGFVDESLLSRPVPEYSRRAIDVSYRARKVPFWLGSFAMEKWTIGSRFREAAERFGLSHDISSDESSRLYGERWIEFLSNSKAVLGTESGASVCDFTGQIRSRVEALVSEAPLIDFDTVQREILDGNDGQVIIHVISPRIFEAAALRTLMINYPGDYSGRLLPWRHYVPLAKDLSNVDEVVAVIRDPDRAQRIIDAAYQEVARNPENSFRAMVAHFDRVVGEELGVIIRARAGSPVISGVRFGLGRLEMISWADVYARRFGRRLRKLSWNAVKPALPERIRKWVEAAKNVATPVNQ